MLSDIYTLYTLHQGKHLAIVVLQSQLNCDCNSVAATQAVVQLQPTVAFLQSIPFFT
jgi:hypothetical protein